jgi:xanthine dehydrogenase small subunit
MKAAQNLLRRFWYETRSEQPLESNAVNAFASRAEGETA